MNYVIKAAALVTIEKHLENTDTVGYGFSKEETDIVFPTMASLFDFGHIKYGSTRNPGPNYEWLREAVKRDPVLARKMATMYKAQLKKLVDEYRIDEAGQHRHRLFNTSIGNMTGYQFEQYLKEIGILKG